MPAVKRAALGLVLAIGWVLTMASPASAHTVSGVAATNWKAILTGVTPSVPGLSVALVEGGSRVEVTNRGPDVVVIGYEGEPYLRVGPDGVFENQHSPTTYLNCGQAACVVPAGLAGAPLWKRIASGRTARWRDRRARPPSGPLPPDVAQSPHQVHQETNWQITMTQGSTPITVTGHYTWIPEPSPIPWLAVAAALAATGAALGLFGYWGWPLALAVAVVTVNDIYHAIGIAWYWSGGLTYRIEKLLSGSFYSAVGWVLGLVAARLLMRKRVDGLYAAVFAGGSAALFTGLLDFTVLTRSQAPFAGSNTEDRLTVIISLGLGAGVVIGSLLALRTLPPALDPDAHDPSDDA